MTRLGVTKRLAPISPAVNPWPVLGRCPYCHQGMTRQRGDNQRTRDHVVPKSMGGRAVVWCCARCNEDKANWLLSEWHAILVAKNDPRQGIVSVYLRRRRKNGQEVDLPGSIPRDGRIDGPEINPTKERHHEDNR